MVPYNQSVLLSKTISTTLGPTINGVDPVASFKSDFDQMIGYRFNYSGIDAQVFDPLDPVTTTLDLSNIGDSLQFAS